MTKNIRRVSYPAFDTDGAAIINVPLPCGRIAIVLPASFEWLMIRSITDQWVWNLSRKGGKGYVRCGLTDRYGNLMTPARFIVEAEKNQIVKYRDGNALNLRDDNLYLASGWAKAREVARMELAA
jgi:hypothetical protein